MANAAPGFDDGDLATALERLPIGTLDALPYGVIRLDADGVARIYNATERRLSGSGSRERVGRDFFAEIAPCMDNPSFRGRIEQARAAGRLDIAFSFVGDFDDPERELEVRVQSATDGGCWIVIRRPA